MTRDELEKALLAAHASGTGRDLSRLYTLAGDQAEGAGRIDAACFYLTQAFVYALECGLPEAAELNRRLADKGRAHLLDW